MAHFSKRYSSITIHLVKAQYEF